VLNAVWFVLGGMAIVFATLSLLVVVMMGLNRWLGPDPEGKPRGDVPRGGGRNG
jgi:Na+-transporting methylmalonyl-CoA/oxaloacetate decarboxylase gamma subunit